MGKRRKSISGGSNGGNVYQGRRGQRQESRENSNHERESNRESNNQNEQEETKDIHDALASETFIGGNEENGFEMFDMTNPLFIPGNDGSGSSDMNIDMFATMDSQEGSLLSTMEDGEEEEEEEYDRWANEPNYCRLCM